MFKNMRYLDVFVTPRRRHKPEQIPRHMISTPVVAALPDSMTNPIALAAARSKKTRDVLLPLTMTSPLGSVLAGAQANNNCDSDPLVFVSCRWGAPSG